MNKSEVIEALAHRTGQSKTAIAEQIDALLELLSGALASGESVQLFGFGRFQVAARGARDGHNPATGEAIKIAATRYVRFIPGKVLKTRINETPATGSAKSRRG